MYHDEKPSRGAQVFLFLVKVMVLGMFALPIVGRAQNAWAMLEAEEAFNKQQAEHRQKMDKMIKELNHVRTVQH